MKKRGKSAKSRGKPNLYVKNNGSAKVVNHKILADTLEEHHFAVADGRKLKNMHELAYALHSMSEDVFCQHVNEQKNDFSNWVKDIFSEDNLAKELQSSKNKIEAQAAVLKRIIKELT